MTFSVNSRKRYITHPKLPSLATAYMPLIFTDLNNDSSITKTILLNAEETMQIKIPKPLFGAEF